jgi:hypothetical protein
MDNKELVTIQIASCGSFKGHPAGPFELTPEVFAECCKNFDLAVPADFEHVSEADPTSGSIPTNGAPAIGWVRRLYNRGLAGLWASVEWLEPAKTLIKEGRYRFISPCVRFGCRDRITGKPVGARLSSIAVVNTPFLRDLAPLTARDHAPGLAVTMTDGDGVVGVAGLVEVAAPTDLTGLTRRLMADEGLCFGDAQIEAALRLRNDRRFLADHHAHQVAPSDDHERELRLSHRTNVLSAQIRAGRGA